MSGMKKLPPRTKPSPLRAPTLAFCRAYAVSDNGTKAYQSVHPNASNAAAAVNASKLLRDNKVLAEIERLRKPADNAVVLTLARKRELLLRFAEDIGVEIKDRLKSIELDGRFAKELNGDANTGDAPVYSTPAELVEVLKIQALALWGRDEDVRLAREAVAAGRAG